MSREPYDPLFEMDGSLDRVADSLHSIDTSLQAIAEHLTGAQETASAPICGAQIVTREVEGMAAEIRLCERRDGPCPWRRPNGDSAGLRGSGFDCAVPT